MINIYQVDTVSVRFHSGTVPSISVDVTGLAASVGWTNVTLLPLETVLSPDGVLDLNFVGDPPTKLVPPGLAPASAHYWTDADVLSIRAILVHARTNKASSAVVHIDPKDLMAYMKLGLGDVSPYIEQLIAQAVAMKGGLAGGFGPGTGGFGGGPFRASHFGGPSGPRTARVMPTYDLGEDGKTAIWHEEIKTLAIGEEVPPTFWQYGAETPPYPWDVEIMAKGTTNPYADTAAGGMFGYPFGQR